MSHQNVRHYWAMPAHSIGETWADKLRRLLRMGNPEPDEGRRRIDPELPYGHWGAGWEGPIYPGQKKSR